jgi:hypothetical protein
MLARSHYYISHCTIGSLLLSTKFPFNNFTKKYVLTYFSKKSKIEHDTPKMAICVIIKKSLI